MQNNDEKDQSINPNKKTSVTQKILKYGSFLLGGAIATIGVHNMSAPKQPRILENQNTPTTEQGPTVTATHPTDQINNVTDLSTKNNNLPPSASVDNKTTVVEQDNNAITNKFTKNIYQNLTEQQKAEKDFPLKILPYTDPNLDYSLKEGLDKYENTAIDALINIDGSDLKESTKEEVVVIKKAKIIKFLQSKK